MTLDTSESLFSSLTLTAALFHGRGFTLRSSLCTCEFWHVFHRKGQRLPLASSPGRDDSPRWQQVQGSSVLLPRVQFGLPTGFDSFSTLQPEWTFKDGAATWLICSSEPVQGHGHGPLGGMWALPSRTPSAFLCGSGGLPPAALGSGPTSASSPSHTRVLQAFIHRVLCPVCPSVVCSSFGSP